MTSTIEIRLLTESQVATAQRLSLQAGWNQLPADWERLIRLWPDSCFGGWIDGRLVATSTLAQYSRQLGWIGMVLVDETCREMGLGTQMLKAAIHAGQTRGLASIGLDATSLGEPLYTRRGFIPCGEVQRWHRPRAVADKTRENSPACNNAATVEALLKLDQQATGIDRGPLLRHVASEAGTRTAALWNGRQIEAAALIRPGVQAWHIGPLVARTAASAKALLQMAACSIAESSSLGDTLIDLPGDTPMAETLRQLNFSPIRTLRRMYLGAPPATITSAAQCFAYAGFELG